MKIRPVGAELFHADGWADGQTDMTKLMVAFRNFSNAPKKMKMPCASLINHARNDVCGNGCIFFSNGSTAPWGPKPPHFSMLHDHTL
jgi:hypothetical protein